MTFLYAHRLLPRYQLIELIEGIFTTKNPDFIIITVAICNDSIHPYELMQNIREAHKNELIEDQDMEIAEEINKNYSIQEFENDIKKYTRYKPLDKILIEVRKITKPGPNS